MTRKEKRLARARHHPKNVTFQELAQLLTDYGFEPRKMRGSHQTWYAMHGDQSWTITIVQRRSHVKPIYVRTAIDLIDQIIEGTKHE